MNKTSTARSLRQEETPAERLLWAHLRNRKLAGLKFRRQYVLEHAIADFCCFAHRLLIELDGAAHDHESAQAADRERDAGLKAQGWRVLRFENRDAMTNLEGILQRIEQAALSPHPCPLSPRERGTARPTTSAQSHEPLSPRERVPRSGG